LAGIGRCLILPEIDELMDINFEYDSVKASERLEIMAAEKLTKLQDKYDFIIRADVFFKKENTSSPDSGMICNMRLSIPGPRLFAEASHGNFEASIAESISDLERQLRKRKEKLKGKFS
jgi:putative sigma-54 modulation protein